MSEAAKILLSDHELAMAQDGNVILTKRAIVEKAAMLFGALAPAAGDAFGDIISANALPTAPMPKISKGENYRGFPYVIMDHPALFGKEAVFAVRTMFWWGNFMSITLHLSGAYKELFAEHIFRNMSGDFFIAAGEDEWQHYFGDDNFRDIASLSANEKIMIMERSFLKVALRYDLKNWNSLQEVLAKGYEATAGLLR